MDPTAAPDEPARGPAALRALGRAAGRLGPDLAPFRHSAQFRLLYGGQAAAFAGTMVSLVAMPYQAYQLSHSSLIVGLLSFTELVPLMAAAIVGGTLADALERRRLIVVTQACLVAGAAMLAANALLWRQLWLLFLIAGLTAAAAGLQRPSVEALVPLLASRDDLTAASALSGLLGSTAGLAGPLAGGVLIAAAGLPAAYLVNAAAGLAGLTMFALMHPAGPVAAAHRPSPGGALAGLRYARSRPELMGTYLIDIGAMLFGAPYALFPQIASRLGGPAVLGLLYAAPDAGSAIVSLTIKWTGRVHRHGRAIVLAVCGWGLAIAAFGFAPDLWLALAALAAAGGADMVSGLFRMTMWNQTIPAGLRGRLAGIEMVSYTTGEPIGNLEAGAVASLTGSVRIAVVSGGLLSLAWALVVTAALPKLWRYDARQPGRAAGREAGQLPAASPTRPGGP